MVEIINITDKEHDDFVMTHKNGDLLQLTSWAKTKELTGWYSGRIAVSKIDRLIGVALLLFKKIPKLPVTMCYVSRGFVCDYKDTEVVKALLSAAKTLAQDERAYTIKIDPDIDATTNRDVIDDLKLLGFKHHGLTDGMSKKVIQPRTTMVTKIDVDDQTLLKSFERNNRTKVRNALKAGTTVVKASRQDLPTFVKLMEETGERDGFLTRDITYFESLYDNLNPNGHMELFLVKLLPNEALNSINTDIEKVRKDMTKAEKIKESHPDGIVLSGALLALSGHKSYYLYGASSNEYREYLPNHHMQWHMMLYAREKGATTYDFGGVSVEPDKNDEHFGLWQFKKVWGTSVSDKVGEFDYVLNKPLYTMAETMIPLFQKAKMKIGEIVRRK